MSGHVFPYLPHTEPERLKMLEEIGVRSFEELIQQIPENIRIKKLNLAEGLSELELTKTLQALAQKNHTAPSQACFLGGGSYQRYVPAVVPAIVSRSEFATSYTPYQPEVSQGTLQTIYEFQSAICLLTGMEIANASMYDGPSAAAEAALMAERLTKRKTILLPDSVNPEYRSVVSTYTKYCGLEPKIIPTINGVIVPSALNIDSSTAALIVQYPNYFGCFENLSQLSEIVHKQGATLIVVTDPIALGLLEPPATYGADIVVGDAQPCGNYLSFGGPSAGFMATRKEFLRQLPGRLAGLSIDNQGRKAFTLTLQTREQHIRRAGATSNICTNQALNALSMLVYLCTMGPIGLKEVAEISMKRAHYLAEKLTAIAGISLLFKQPFFSEFVIKIDGSAQKWLEELKSQGILGGLPLVRFFPQLHNCILVSVTELNSIEEIDRYIKAATHVI
jgi:glycine dehydrogenase subunit 1